MRVGDVVNVRVGLRAPRLGVVVGLGANAKALDVQIGSAIENIPPERVKGRVRAAEGSTAAGRIYATMKESSHRGTLGRLKLGWDPELLWPAIEQSAEGDQALQLALDLVEQGDCEAITRFSLSADERSRLRAWRAQWLGHHGEALELLLEADPRSADLPAWSIAAWVNRDGGPLVTSTELLPRSGPGLVATVLQALSKGEKPELFELQAISGYLHDVFGHHAQARLVASAIEAVAEGETTVLLDDNPTMALHRALSGRAELDAKHAISLADWPLSLTDDLIDARRLTAAAVRRIPESAKVRVCGGAPVALRSYLLARLDPEALDDASVVALRFSEEAERRYIEKGNPAFKKALSESRRQRLESMRTLREGRPLDRHAEDRLRSEDPQGRLLAQVSSMLRTGAAAGLASELHEDGSVVELIASATEAVGLQELPERLAAPVALRRAIDRIFCWDWEGAAEQARMGLRRASRESVRDELLNLLAYALWELGNDDAAVAALNKAIDGQYNSALISNRRVVTLYRPEDQRNPYIILGVPYGASKAEASEGHARALRRLKKDPDATYSESDLSWAIYQIEQVRGSSRPDDGIYRIPADPAVYSDCQYGLLQPRPVAMKRRTDRSHDDFGECLMSAAGTELLRHLLDEHGGRVEPEAPFLSMEGETAKKSLQDRQDAEFEDYDDDEPF